MLRRLARGRSGFSLAELMIASTVSLVVLVAVGLFLVTAIKSESAAALRRDDEDARRRITEYFADRMPAARVPLRQAYDFQVEFAHTVNGTVVYSTVWVDCAGDRAIKVYESPTPAERAQDPVPAGAPWAGVYPPPEDAPAPPDNAIKTLGVLAEGCGAEPLFTYHDEGGAESTPLPSSDPLARTSDTETIVIESRLANGSRFRLVHGLGVISDGDALTPVLNGSFDTWSGSPGTDHWTVSGAGTASQTDSSNTHQAGDPHALRLESDGSGDVAVTSDPVAVQGDTLGVWLRMDTGLTEANCTIEVLDANGVPLYAVSLPENHPVGTWASSPIAIPLESQAGQVRQLRLSTVGAPAGTACTWDAVVSIAGQ